MAWQDIAGGLWQARQERGLGVYVHSDAFYLFQLTVIYAANESSAATGKERLNEKVASSFVCMFCETACWRMIIQHWCISLLDTRLNLISHKYN